MPDVKKQYVNREISWLSFNERVLQEAANPNVPLIERLKFLGIYSSNLDEFFRVRVGTLKRMVKAGIKGKGVLGGSPQKILDQIQDIVIEQRRNFDRIFGELMEELENEKIYIINEEELNSEQEAFVQNYFEQEVRPRLVPVMLNFGSKFPYLRNQVIYLAIHMSNQANPDDFAYALIEVPADLLPRFIVLPGVDDRRHVIMLDDIIRYGLKEIFAIFDYNRFEAYTVKLTRDAELDIEDDITQSLFEKISKSVKQRVRGEPVRFVYGRNIPDDLLQFVLKRNNMKGFDNLIPGGRYHNARDFMKFPDLDLPHLKYEKKPVLQHGTLDSQRSIFDAIKQKDALLHYPYQSFRYTIDLLREAAIDPKVKSISMTLYRVAKNSNVINALINAIRNGKTVRVLMELKARFDEEANILWTQTLEEEGAHLMESIPGLKIHAKLCLITREENKKKVRYAIVGTGNFNEETAEIYSDHALITADKRLTREVEKVFEFLDNTYKTQNYRHLVVSPFYMRKKFVKLIKSETKNAKAGKQAYIYVKLNSLVDQKLIDKLYEASRAGVTIKMVVRGICSLVPGVPGLSENIEVISIVDKYLEHSRIFIFCNEGDELYFISSADWMIRNMDNRVEVATPIYDKDIQNELKRFFEIQFRDNQKARIIDEEQKNRFRDPGHARPWRAQIDCYEFLKNGRLIDEQE